MNDLATEFAAALDRRQALAYCRLVETRGSTPQKAGATMLIFPDGTQAGTLGGGCVEAEVKRRSLAVIDSQQAEISRFQLDHDYGWDDGLICGGRMEVLIEPVIDDHAVRYYRRLCELIGDGRGMTEAVVFAEEPTGLSAPRSYLFDSDGRSAGILQALSTADEVPVEVTRGLLPLAERPRPYVSQGIAYLPVLPRCRLLIVGGGHVGKAVAELAADLEFDVWVVDDRETYASAERFPRVEKRISGDIDETLADVEVTPDTYCLIVTRGHSHDQRALYHLADRGARYVGMIGSRRKIKMIFDDLANEGISMSALDDVHAPVGMDIGSQTVPEIAVSICAELVAHRNCGGNIPGKPSGTAVAGSRREPA